ncbi:MAG: hypothetical protein JRH20_15930 [Deltaproteobacteria bacterium]|nr:hypothetical protein [Deltaproteobacteria bacterium]
MSAASKITPPPLPCEDARAEGAESPTEQRRAHRMMAVAGSFAPLEETPEEQTYGPLLGSGAPSLKEAVERFMRAAHPEGGEGDALFGRLLGDGPPIEIEEFATKPVDPPWDALLDVSLEAARQCDENEEADEEDEEGVTEALPPKVTSSWRAPEDEPTTAATPAAISGDPSSRRGVPSYTYKMDVEDHEEDSFRREDGSDDELNDEFDDDEEILDDRGCLVDHLPTPSEGVNYPSVPLRREATRGPTLDVSLDLSPTPAPSPTPRCSWPDTPSHLALPQIDPELLEERQGLDPALMAEPITRNFTPELVETSPVEWDQPAEDRPAKDRPPEEQGSSGSTAELLTDSDILTGEFEPVMLFDSSMVFESAMLFEPVAVDEASAEEAAPEALPDAPPPHLSLPDLPALPEPPEDLVPIAAVQVKRLDQPTDRGFRLSLEDAPTLGAAPALGRSESAPPARGDVLAALTPRLGHGGFGGLAHGMALTYSELLPASRRSQLRRHWPIFAGLTIVFVTLVALGALWLHQQLRASRHLEAARRMAAGSSHLQLKGALEQARLAATEGGRSVDVVALAAAAHARLAYEFGESSLVGVAALAEEAKRLGAPRGGRAAKDLTLADATLRLATSSLPQSIDRLRDLTAADPSDLRLQALYGRLLLRAKRFSEAGRVLGAGPLASGGRWLRLRARLALALGQKDVAQSLWTRARQQIVSSQMEGRTSAAQVELDGLRAQVHDEQQPEGLFAKAQQLAKEASLSTRERAWAHVLAATIAQKRAHWPDARFHLTRALKAEPLADPEFYAMAAWVALRAGECKWAREQAERALQLLPGSAEMLALRAKVALALDNAPHAHALLLRCGKGCLQQGQLLRAEAALARGELSRASAFLAASSAKGTLRHTMLQARLLLTQKRYRHARNMLTASPEEDARVWYLRGLIALEEGHRAVFLASGRGASSASQQTASSHSSEGVARRWHVARRALERAIVLHPWHAAAHAALGRLHAERGHASAAQESLARAAAANPYVSATRLDLGGLLLRLGRFAEALDHFETVLRRDGKDTAALAGRARCRVELVMSSAEEDIAQLAAQGHVNTALLLRGRLAMRQGEYTLAAGFFDQVDEDWLQARGRALVWQAISWGRISERRAAQRRLRALAQRGQGAEAAISEQLVRSAALLALGEFAFSRRGYKTALALGTRALRSLPPRFRPVDLSQRMRLLRARSLKRLGAPRLAMAELKEISSQSEAR